MHQYMVDANIFLNASRNYYPIDAVPQFWSLSSKLVKADIVKMPIEVFDEIHDKKYEDDPLIKWIKNQGEDFKKQIILDKTEYASHVDHITKQYASLQKDKHNELKLTEEQLKHIGADTELIASAYADRECRIIVTNEHHRTNSKPAIAEKMKIPYICVELGIQCIDIFELCRRHDFNTRCN